MSLNVQTIRLLCSHTMVIRNWNIELDAYTGLLNNTHGPHAIL